MTKFDNPAGRLKEIFKRARAIKGGTVKSGFAQTFELADQEDFGEVYTRLAAVNDTADDVAAQLKVLENQEFYRIYAADLPRIRRFVQPWDYLL